MQKFKHKMGRRLNKQTKKEEKVRQLRSPNDSHTRAHTNNYSDIRSKLMKGRNLTKN